ncbi:hypothetical protein CY34DRAFT_19685 [Suillus luteus UH-Slu-Lm8-n1]|uniref:Uncharacterized protein n=1 Tax=Suillus luteus UH-Slu-Lm8-n1 TaxID=930992 RepID=A0A0C9ZQR7_9AGAM|nr:hypothetical protein CY34DRAFT_19685 [Suillus luteus UH-Slu-Lm8-n1]
MSARHFAPFRIEEQITPERDRQSQRERDRLNRLQMTSPGRCNRRHAARENQDRPLPPVPQPNFMLPNLQQAGPVWQPPPNFPHQPLPVEQYPGLPRNAIAHVQHAHRLPRIDFNARLNEQMNIAHDERLRRRNLRRRQDREEIRRQVHEELMPAGMQPLQQHHIPDGHLEPHPPAPLIHGPHPAPPVPALLQPEHLQVEQIRNHLLHRQEQEVFHQQWLQQQLQQQENDHIHRQAQEDLEAFQLQQQEVRQAQVFHELQQREAERIDRQNQDILRAQQQEEEAQCHRAQRIREREERQQEALREYNLPASQEHHDDDEERRRNRLQADREERNLSIPTIWVALT